MALSDFIILIIPSLVILGCNFIPLLFPQISRLVYKYFYPKKYVVPKLTAYDYPLPPYPNTWYPVCLSSSIRENEHVAHKITGRELVFFRGTNGRVQAVPKNCPHMGVDLEYGYVEHNCMVCPMHCKHVRPDPADNIFVEETNNIIFIWYGESPPITISELFSQNKMESITILPYGHLSHRVGGHLVDYAEHLLDIHHAPYIHGVHITPIENGVRTTQYSFTTQFHIEKSDNNPIFTYVTPTFGNIQYAVDVNVCIMFIVHDIGDIEMVIMPCWINGFSLAKVGYSIIAALYTFVDFLDEAAYFSTKNHHVRNMKDSESPMVEFREWFHSTFYTRKQWEKFTLGREKYKQIQKLNDW